MSAPSRRSPLPSAATFAAISCPLKRARDITGTVTSHTLPRDLAALRVAALVEARTTDHSCPDCALTSKDWTVGQIADYVGVTQPRVSQITAPPRKQIAS